MKKETRNKLVPFVNRYLIRVRRYSDRYEYKGYPYYADYHRTQYWYDDKPITLIHILQCRKLYHVDIWQGYPVGKGRICTNSSTMFFAKNRKSAKALVKDYCQKCAIQWDTLVRLSDAKTEEVSK